MTALNKISRSDTSAMAAEHSETVLIMRLSGEAFGLPVRLVHEIMDPIPVTRVPRASRFAPGLINVRGAVVPIVDIRERLRMASAPPCETARIVVLNLPGDTSPLRLAILADAVDEVIEVNLANRETIPDLGAPWPETYVAGVTRHRDGIVVLLNTETLFRPDNAPLQRN